ncbi:MAG: 3-oxoacyl-[acyl-carrier-protein] reductase [Endomicrobium sp.]|jgi:3-oxoacyl-[acyl-carrier protein] reductase|nr:3-oxoacyl-[acyl-carrier-protein] reductase [Endomicrobium sp.]
MKLYNKVAIVTGSAQGIGRSIAEIFAFEGANIVVSDININLAQQTANEIKTQYHVEVIAVASNVSKLEDCKNLVKTSLDKFNKIDILVNNAGITKDNLVLKMSEFDWDSVIAVNLKGVFNCTKAVSRIMLKRREGKIVNIASVVAQMGNPGQVNYSASKGGIIAMTKTCAREFAERNVLVNAIAPGFIKTAMTEKLTTAQRHAMISAVPLAKFGDASDIAKAALFLVSDDNTYITGHILAVNGGMYM